MSIPQPSDYITMLIPVYSKPRRELWSPESEYLSHNVNILDLTDQLAGIWTMSSSSKKNPNHKSIHSSYSPHFAIIGFCSDIGIERNKGRVGAASAPDEIRKAMRLSSHLDRQVKITDVGNIRYLKVEKEKIRQHLKAEISHFQSQRIKTGSIMGMQTESDLCLPPFDLLEKWLKKDDYDPIQAARYLFSKIITWLLDQQITPFALGGGHEIAKGHFDGIQRSYPEKQIGIINVDAHYDLREPIKGPNSGTSFFEIYTSQVNGNNDYESYSDVINRSETNPEINFHYMVIGLNPKTANEQLIENSRKTSTCCIPVEMISSIDQKQAVNETMSLFIRKSDLIYVTICMDVMDKSLAPGVSAVNGNGLTMSQLQSILKPIITSNKMVSIDIAEVNPSYDVGKKTVRLASDICLLVIATNKSAFT